VGAGEIAAMFGVDCATGTTFTKPGLEPKLSLMNMHVPNPVISLAIKPKDKAGGLSNFSKVGSCCG
jgi:elongation factor G